MSKAISHSRLCAAVPTARAASRRSSSSSTSCRTRSILLLSAFEGEQTPEMELRSVEVSPQGEVRALVSVEGRLALLVVTLQGRPIESYLRIVGTNGSINADFILAGVTKLPGPGASAPAVVLRPFSQARQMVFGSIATLFKMFFRRHKSYPGLAELLQGFYASINGEGQVPVSPESIIQTVRLCEQIGRASSWRPSRRRKLRPRRRYARRKLTSRSRTPAARRSWSLAAPAFSARKSWPNSEAAVGR
jgi:hypothetical protein